MQKNVLKSVMCLTRLSVLACAFALFSVVIPPGLNTLYAQDADKESATSGDDEASPATDNEDLEESSPDALIAYSDAASFQNNGAFDVAVEAWEKFLKEFGDDAKALEATYNLGVSKLHLKDFDGAIATLQKVASSKEKFDRRDDALLNLGWAQYSLAVAGKKEQFANASKVFSQLIKEAPKSKIRDQALFFLGESLYMQGDREAAATAYRSLVDEFEKSDMRADGMYALGVTLEELGKFKESSNVYDKYIGEFADKELVNEVKMRKAETILRQGNFGEAEKQFAEVSLVKDFAAADHAMFRQGFCVAQQERFEDAGKLFAAITEKFPKSRYFDQATMATGRSYFRAKNLKLASEWFEKAIKKGGIFAPEAAHWRSRIYLGEKAPGKALQVVRASLADSEKSPFHVNLLMDEADALYEIPAKREDALIKYSAIVEKYPKHVLGPQALYNAAFGSMELKRHQEGFELASRFVKDFPKHRLLPDVKHVAAECKLALGENESAAELFADVQNSASDSGQASNVVLRQALAMYLDKKYDGAIKLLKEKVGSFKSKDETAEGLYILGVSLLGNQQYANAEKSLAKALSVKPDFRQADEAMLNLSRAQRKQNELDDAIQTIKKVVTNYPKSEILHRAHYRLAEYSYAKEDYSTAADEYEKVLSLNKQPNLTPYALYGLGWAQLRKNDHDDSILTFTKLIADHADHKLVAQSVYARAMGYQQSRRYDKALADLSEFLKAKRSPQETADALYIKGLCEVGTKKSDAAAKTFQSILTKYPNYASNDKVLYELAWTYRSLKNEKSASATFQQLADKFPKSSLSAEAFYHQGETQYAAGEYETAIVSYRAAQGRLKDNAELSEKILYKLGWAHYQEKKYDEAIQAFDVQAKDHPDRSLRNDAVFMKGECLFKMAKYDQALAIFEAVKGKPVSSEQIAALTLLHGGQAAGQLGKWQESVSWLAELSAKFPKSSYVPTGLYEQAWAYQNLKRLNDALKLYNAVTDRSRGEVGARARFMMGEIYYGNQQYDVAIREFQKVMFGYGADKAKAEIKRWQAKAGYEAGQCAGLLAAKQQDRERRAQYVDAAKKFFEYVRARHPDTKEATAANEQLKKYVTARRN